MRMTWIMLTLGCSGFKHADNDDQSLNYESEDTNDDPLAENGDNWLAGLQSVNDGSSSSSIQLRWNPPSDSNLNHYQLVFTDTISAHSNELFIEANEQSVLLTGLKSETEYAVELSACLDDACSTKIASQYNQISVSTASEIWRLQGTGHSLDELERIFNGEELIPHPYQSENDSMNIELYLLASDQQIWKRGLQSNDDSSLDTSAIIDSEVFSCPESTCEDTSLSAFQILPSSTEEASSQLIVQAAISDASPSLYSIEGYSNQSTCQLYDDCQLSLLFDHDQLLLSNFQLHQKDELSSFLLLEAYSDCSEDTAVFFAIQENNSWDLAMDISGCPRHLIPDAVEPSLLAETDHLKLYFRLDNKLHFIYAEHYETFSFASWEDHSVMRSTSFQWPDGEELSPTDHEQLTSMKVLFSEIKYVFFAIPASEYQEAGIGFATLINP